MISLFNNVKDENKYYDYYDKTMELFEIPFTSLMVSTSFGDTHVLQFGDSRKEAFVLIHGMTMSSTMWYPNIKYFIEDYCVYAVDILGDFGKSKVKTIINNKEAAANWLNEVMKGLKLESCNLGGHSMGGFLAINFSLTYPKLVKKLVLYAPAGTFQPLKLKFFIKIFPSIYLQSEKLTDKAFLWLSGLKQGLHPTLRNQIIACYTKAKPQIHLVPSVFRDHEFDNYNIPTLLIIGDKEVLYSATKALKKAKQVIPNLQSELIVGASHTLTYEQANEINSITLNYLRQ